jgi:hypothetical protein
MLAEDLDDVFSLKPVIDAICYRVNSLVQRAFRQDILFFIIQLSLRARAVNPALQHAYQLIDGLVVLFT